MGETHPEDSAPKEPTDAEVDERMKVEFDEPPVALNTSLSTYVLVENLPQVGEDRISRLEGVLTKIFAPCGPLVKTNAIRMPRDESGNSTKGIGFVEFETAEAAEKAVSKLHGYKLDKTHVLQVTGMDTVAETLNQTEQFVEPSYAEYKAKENPLWWLTDELARDQFATHIGIQLNVSWLNENLGRAEDPLVSRRGWTENGKRFQWSGRGTYLVTFHSQGIRLWAGESWSKVNAFAHPGVHLVEFSPCEKYLVTYSPPYWDDTFEYDRTGENIVSSSRAAAAAGGGGRGNARNKESAAAAAAAAASSSKREVFYPIVVWNVLSGRIMNRFTVPVPSDMQPVDPKVAREEAIKRLRATISERQETDPEFNIPPVEFDATVDAAVKANAEANVDKVRRYVTRYSVRWSPDDSYFTLVTADAVGLYDAATARLHSDKPLKLVGVQDAQWSPRENVLACFVPEAQNVAARVVFVDMPARTIRHTYTMFRVSDCQLHWSKQGEYLLAHVRRTGKKSKALRSQFTLFRMDDKAMPAETLDIEDTVMDVAWEPRGNRFAVLHTRRNTDPYVVSNKNEVTMYSMRRSDLELVVAAPSGAGEPAAASDGGGAPAAAALPLTEQAPGGGDGAAITSASKLTLATGSSKSYTVRTLSSTMSSAAAVAAAAVSFVKLGAFDNRPVNRMLWSPMGTYLVLIGVDALGGALEFVDAERMESLRRDQHLMISDFSWDPSGRFLATWVSFAKVQFENGYSLWNFQGKKLRRCVVDQFLHFAWRPRPASRLTVAQVEAVKKNLKAYSKRYAREDAEKKGQEARQARRKRDEARADFMRLYEARLQAFKEQHAARAALRGYDSDGGGDADDAVIELVRVPLQCREVD